MRDIISIHIGKAGIHLGNSCWELFCLEHGIHPDGHIMQDPSYKSEDLINTFFVERPSGRYIPRALFVDLEPSAINEVLTGEYRKIYHPNQFVSGKEDAAGIYARGHYTIGKEYIDLILDKIRKLSESCIGIQGFMIYSSVGGGTGSGLGSLLLERLSVEYSKKMKLGLNIYPSDDLSTSFTESYNTCLLYTSPSPRDS